MKNLITTLETRAADEFTITNKPISAIKLMESAAKAFVKVFQKTYPDLNQSIVILCGKGNNGGDGLAIARLLNKLAYSNIIVYLLQFSKKQSDGYTKNLKKLNKLNVECIKIDKVNSIHQFNADIIIDAIIGSGLNKPFTGEYAELANIVNQSNSKVVSVDIPSGFNAEGPIANHYNGIKADLTITFQRPKINFFFPESVQATNKFKVVDIGLSEDFIESLPSEWKLLSQKDVQQSIKLREPFTHKGSYGHALIIAGNNTTMGAALLAASASLHSGSGLTTACLPQSGLTALNTALPEVMALPRNQYLAFEAFEKFNAIGAGPGLGDDKENEELLENLVKLNKALVLDADMLTILSRRQDLIYQLPEGTILTPHMKEFDRLFGEHSNWWERTKTAIEQAKAKRIIIVLKNQFTFICLPSGEICINPTGNPAMASGGMGDVLTGMITSFLAQSYSPREAALLAVFIHGKAGDELAKGRFTVSASQLAEQIPKTIKKMIFK